MSTLRSLWLHVIFTTCLFVFGERPTCKTKHAERPQFEVGAVPLCKIDFLSSKTES